MALAGPHTRAYTEFFTDFPEARTLLGSSSGTGFSLWQSATGLLAKVNV